MKRTFFAIKVSSETEALLRGITTRFPEFHNKIKIANLNNPHITLKFLGDTDEKLIDKIDGVLQESFTEVESFSYSCVGTGCFPKPTHSSVLWIGIKEGLKYIQKIHTLLEHHLENSGIEKDKRNFSPHLTYGRVNRYVNKLDSIDKFLKYEFEPTENFVNEIVWFESKLTSMGAIHKPLRIYKLK